MIATPPLVRDAPTDAGRRRLLEPRTRPQWQAYLFAALVTLATLGARMLAGFELGGSPVVIAFTIPIIVSAIVGGIGPGLFATAIAALIVPYFLLEPQFSLGIARGTHAASWLAMIAVGVLSSALIEALHRSRRRLEAAERLRTVTLASIGEAVVSTGFDGRIEFMNAEAERLTGWSSAQAAGRPIADVLRVARSGTREPAVDIIEALRASRVATLAQDLVLTARDGREIAIESSVAPIRASGGAPRGAVFVLRDCSATRAADRALRESEERLRLAQDTAGVGVFDFDLEAARLTWSRSLERIYGLAPGERVTTFDEWLRRIHTDDADAVARAWRRTIEAGEPLDLELRIVTAAGEVRWVAAKGSAFRRDDGTPYRVLGIGVDISDRRRSEDEARRAYEVLALALRASHSGVWDYDFTTGSSYVSPEYLDLYGVPGGTPIDRHHWLERVHPDDRERMRAASRKLLDEGTEWSVEFRIAHPIRGERWIAGRGTLARAANRRPLRFTGADMDVTDRRRAQEALLDSEMRFRSYVEDAPIAMFVASRDGRIVECNPAAVDLLGYEAATLRRMRAYELVAPEDRDAAVRAFQTVLDDGRIAGEFRAAPRDGRPLYVSVRGVRLADGQLMAFCSDVTARWSAEAALRDNEARFRQLIESLPQLVWTCSAGGDCDYVGPQCLGYTGAGADLHYGRGWLDFLHPEDRAATQAAWQRASARGDEYRGEFRMQRSDGTYRWFDGRVVPLRDAAGRVVHWFGIATDIHDARELRETLRREKERFIRLAAAAPGVVHTFAIERDGRPTFRYASPAIAEIYGYDASALERDATAALERIHPDDAARIARSAEQSARTMNPWREEFRVRHPDKGEIWVEGHSAPVREADGTIVWHGILHDITARKRMEEALRMSRSQLLAALEAGGMGAWTWDVADDRFAWDESGLRALGIEAPDARAGLDVLLDHVHPSDRERVRASVDALIRHGTHASGEYRTTRRDGATRWIEFTARVERDDEGRARRLIGINVDVTNRKRAEEAQLRSQKLEALGTLAGGIAHDFNNILVAITGNTRLAKSDLPRGHPAQESLDEIARAGARAVDLVRRILTFSRPHDHRREVLAPAPVVDEALTLVRATLPANVEIRTRYADDVPHASIDPTQVHQIIVNLATNASHAIGTRGGHIDVRVDAVLVGPEAAGRTPGLREGRYVRLEVEDDGSGIDETTLERIFDPFFTTKPQGLGTGLGLSVVHGIVKSHDGAISVDSEPGRGTAFRIYLPAVETADGGDDDGAKARRVANRST